MHCPFCSHQDTKVTDSRLVSEGRQIRRRRECLNCGERFSTYETPELSLPKVVKSDGRRERFSEEKLRAGFDLALEKRPVKTESIEEAIQGIIHRLVSSGEREIESRLLGDRVMEALKQLDQVAYIRFASVYRAFEDVDAFKEAVDRLLADPEEQSADV